MAKAFSQEVSEYHARAPLNNHQTGILLIHYGDDSPEVLHVERVVTVYYGGAGEPSERETSERWDKRQDKRENVERIWRAVSRDEEVSLTISEAEELKRYATALSGGLQPEKPAFLKPSQSYQSLVALAILCQGYLVASDPKWAGLSVPMRQVVLESGAANMVASNIYWELPFAELDTEGTGNPVFAVQKLEARVRTEWTGSTVSRDPVDKLLSEIAHRNVRNKPVVEKALSAIQEYFDRA